MIVRSRARESSAARTFSLGPGSLQEPGPFLFPRPGEGGGGAFLSGVAAATVVQVFYGGYFWGGLHIPSPRLPGEGGGADPFLGGVAVATR